jgi:iron complex outermembrane receptor protein
MFLCANNNKTEYAQCLTSMPMLHTIIRSGISFKTRVNRQISTTEIRLQQYWEIQMKSKFYKINTITMALAATIANAYPLHSFAQEEDTDAQAESDAERIIVTGTRLSNRSAADSPVPVDVISGDEFRQNSSTDVQDMLRTAVPSFDVNTQPISDAATVVRPANLRGLSPDNVLVLVNGKRRHRGSIISFLGGGISDGAQGVDISAIPSMALKRVEVLRA